MPTPPPESEIYDERAATETHLLPFFFSDNVSRLGKPEQNLAQW